MEAPLPAVLFLLLLMLVLLVLRAVAWWSLVRLRRLLVRLAGLQPGAAGVNLVRATARQRAPCLYGVLYRRFDPHRLDDLPLTLLVTAALYTLVLLGGLVDELREAGDTIRFDTLLQREVTRWQTPALVVIFAWITDLGGSAALLAVALTASGLCLAFRHPWPVAALWLTFIGSQATTWLGKYALDRARPLSVAAVEVFTPSFPSGHATGAMAVYGFLAYVIARELSGVRPRFEVVYWMICLVALVGFSRVFLGVHFPIDVAAGFLVGLFWLLAGFALAERNRSGGI